jgi:hypothetical protein
VLKFIIIFNIYKVKKKEDGHDSHPPFHSNTGGHNSPIQIKVIKTL